MSRKRLKNIKRQNSSSLYQDNNVIQLEDYTTPTRTRKKKVEIIPRNQAQEQYILSIEDNTITFGVGPAGTGKTLIATLMAIQALKSGEIERIVVTRPAVSVDEQHGFLPGDLNKKLEPWTRPIFDVFEEYYSPKQIAYMIEEKTIEIAPLAYMRGRTMKNCFVIADETQNATPSQMKMLLTRIGDDSKMVVTGDLDQHDRGYEKNGLKDFIQRLERKMSKNKIDNISIVKFTSNDIERHPVVSQILDIYRD